jgi:hypothetical protein
MQALLDSHVSVQALASRNAVVSINNIFGDKFRALQPRVAAGEDIEFDSLDIETVVRDLEMTLDMLVGQLPVTPYREVAKFAVPKPAELITEYRKFVHELFQLREMRMKLGAHRLDVMTQLVRQCYFFWVHASPLLK